jgi:hypothetical protein
VQNIENIDRIIDLYIEKDSLYFLVFNKLVTQEDYQNSSRLFHFAFSSDRSILQPLGYERTGLVNEDYKEPIAGKNKITGLQDSIFSELKGPVRKEKEQRGYR